MNPLEIDPAFAVKKGDGDRAVKAVDDRRLLMGQIVYEDLFPVGVDEPVFGYAGVGVLVQLQIGILSVGEGREDFRDKVRRSIDAAPDDLVPVTDDQHVRLQYGPVVPVKLDVDGSDEWQAIAAFGFNIIP